MRRYPTQARMPQDIPAPKPPRRTKQPQVTVQTQSALIEPFLVSGGQGFFQDFDIGGEGADARAAGTQLICSVYVPRGRVGFIKQIRVAPFIPPVFSDPWRTTGANGATWQQFNSGDSFDTFQDRPYRPGGQAGLWETPFGWESYIAFTGDGGEKPLPPAAGLPSWEWSLRFLQGGVDQLRQQGTNIPIEAPTYEVDGEGNVVLTGTANQFYMVPGVPVPTQVVYPGNSLPGTAPAPSFGPQKTQQLPSDPLQTHILIPENTSACLFAQWRQTPITKIWGRDGNGLITIWELPEEQAIYPLLPSFGSLHGFMQNSLAPQTLHNAQLGWGG